MFLFQAMLHQIYTHTHLPPELLHGSVNEPAVLFIFLLTDERKQRLNRREKKDTKGQKRVSHMRTHTKIYAASQPASQPPAHTHAHTHINKQTPAHMCAHTHTLQSNT